MDLIRRIASKILSATAKYIAPIDEVEALETSRLPDLDGTARSSIWTSERDISDNEKDRKL